MYMKKNILILKLLQVEQRFVEDTLSNKLFKAHISGIKKSIAKICETHFFNLGF